MWLPCRGGSGAKPYYLPDVCWVVDGPMAENTKKELLFCSQKGSSITLCPRSFGGGGLRIKGAIVR